MKIKKLIYMVTVALTLSLSSCSDFLEIKPNNLVTGSSLAAENLPALTSPLYNVVWADFNSQFYYGLGDGASYNLYAPYSNYIYPFADFSVTGLTGPLVNAWSSFYQVIQQSNKVIISIRESSASDEIKNRYIGEARFMRGTAYYYLASLWGNVVISEDPTSIVNNPVINTNPRSDAFEFAIRDLEFAAKYLPENASESGRIDRYSAFGMLSRVYLAYSGYVSNQTNPNSGIRNSEYLEFAKKAAEKVITNSKYELMNDYTDLFKIENNNNSESMFAFQWVPGMNSTTGWGVINNHQAYFAYSSEITGDDAAWGDWTRASYDVIKEYSPVDTIRRRATWMGYGDFYPEINKAGGGLLCQRSNGQQMLNVKKGVVGSTKDNPAIARMNSALNTYMLRLAEVYLNYAEAILGNNSTTTDDNAIFYFNKVRIRAKMPEKQSISYEDIRYERRVEFCMEGQYWYDLLSRSYYKQQDVIEYLIAQHRETIVPFLFESPNILSLDSSREEATRSVGNIDASVFLLPYPSDEVIKNPLLRESPVPYQFTEERITDLFN
ncbi:MAG: RagB/SusD family nutrient uptake outer membrane protein [Prevotellaceae bacterium]|nr:RagB/SusD family nutrient uptake outer membrane protein [Prevotellaceae bacterium]